MQSSTACSLQNLHKAEACHSEMHFPLERSFGGFYFGLYKPLHLYSAITRILKTSDTNSYSTVCKNKVPDSIASVACGLDYIRRNSLVPWMPSRCPYAESDFDQMTKGTSLARFKVLLLRFVRLISLSWDWGQFKL